MGYTHTFKHQKDISTEAWSMIRKDFHALLGSLPDHSESAGGHFSDKPLSLKVPQELAHSSTSISTEHNICFNGDEADDMDHEDFWLSRVKLDEKVNYCSCYCKTARKPYDLVVCATLMLVNFHAPGAMLFDSDGEQEDWEPARIWMTNVLGKPFSTPRFGLGAKVSAAIDLSSLEVPDDSSMYF